MSFTIVFKYYLFIEVRGNGYTLVLADSKVVANGLIEV